LTDAKLRTLKSGPSPQKFADFEGLFVLLSPNGSRLWRLAYRFGGKQKLLALGAYPDVSLRDARKAKEEARELLSRDLDPAHERKVAKAKKKIVAGHTFEAAANDWFDARSGAWVGTLMAIVPIALSLIDFGFTLNKVFTELAIKGVLADADFTARRLGGGLLTLGLLLFIMGILSHWRFGHDLTKRRAQLYRRRQYRPMGAWISPGGFRRLVRLEL
jgi:uncharacterized membrane protein YidH (DUF202 family)